MESKDLLYRIMKIETLLEDLYDLNVNNKKKCSVCNSDLRLFVPFGVKLRRNAKCPVCGSMERHRAFFRLLTKDGFFTNNKKVKLLHFAPEPCFFEQLGVNENIDYYPVDFDPDYPGIVRVVDITDIPYHDNEFDFIFCHHVLEHIPDDKTAMAELYRVLKVNGLAYISVPLNLKLSETLEKDEYNTPELRLKYYNQEDHVRFYSLDVVDRLETAGFIVTVVKPNKDLSDEELYRYGLIRNAIFFKCEKKI